MAQQDFSVVDYTGPMLLGNFFNWGLMGVLAVQAYIYYLAFPNDRMIPKFVVCWTILLEIVQTVLSTRDAFKLFGTNWGDKQELDNVGLGWFSVPVMAVIITLTVQSFYAWRIWILSNNIWIPIFVMILAIGQGTAGIYTGVYTHTIGFWSQVRDHIFVSSVVWLVGTASCDVIIAGTMVFYLKRSKTGFQATKLLLARFIRIIMETGFACAAIAIIDLALYLPYHNNYHLTPCFILSKLYSNSMLVLLNARVRIDGGRMMGSPVAEDPTLSGYTTSINTCSTHNRTISIGYASDKSDILTEESNQTAESKPPNYFSIFSRSPKPKNLISSGKTNV